MRALAVLAVLVFHADLPVSGGFVGVDMFFVISGFVITLMLQRELKRTGRIALGQFYLRRFKRLTPALALAVAGSAVLSTLFLSPLGQQSMSLSTGLGCLFLVGNWVIHEWTGPYFAPDSAGNLLLHTWSLSVEEQFYLLFPAVLTALSTLARRLPHRVGRLVPAAGASALALLSLAAVGGVPGVATGSFVLGYYSPVNRAWEFLAGVLLALLGNRIAARRVWAATSLGVGGLVLVTAALFLIGPQTPFPGKWTLLPVAGTALLIAAGLGATNPISAALAWRPLVVIGDWSYSLYLWHWPFVVVGKTLFPFADWAAPVATLLAVLPAYASYRFVETPLRTMELRDARVIGKRVAQVLGVPLLMLGLAWAVTAGTTHAIESGAFRSRFTNALTQQPTPDVCPWPALADLIAGNGRCTASGPAPEVVVIGDSHAEALFAAAPESLRGRSVGLVTVRSPHLFATAEGRDLVSRTIRAESTVRTVVIARMFDRSDAGMLDAERSDLRAFVTTLVAGGKQVLVTDDLPIWPSDIFTCAFRTSLVVPGEICEADRAYFARRLGLVSPQLDGALAQTGAHRVGTFWTFCDQTTCRRAEGDVLLYRDEDHVTPEGAARLWQSILADPAAREVLGP